MDMQAMRKIMNKKNNNISKEKNTDNLYKIFNIEHLAKSSPKFSIKVLENLNKLNKRFVLMSNAPRPSKSVEKFLLKLKLNKIFLKNIFYIN